MIISQGRSPSFDRLLVRVDHEYAIYCGIAWMQIITFHYSNCCVLRVMYRSNRSVNMPPPPPGIWHLCRPGEEGIWLSESSRVWGIWSPCVRGGEFELYPRFHVKFLAWRAVIRDAVFEDFRGKDCAFVANWLQGLCRIWRYLNFNIFDIGFRLWIYECIKLCL